MKKITLTVIKEDSGFSAHTKVANNFIATEGNDLPELTKNILEAINLSFEGKCYTIDDVVLKADLSSFFEFYKVINAKV